MSVKLVLQTLTVSISLKVDTAPVIAFCNPMFCNVIVGLRILELSPTSNATLLIGLNAYNVFLKTHVWNKLPFSLLPNKNLFACAKYKMDHQNKQKQKKTKTKQKKTPKR